MGTMRDHGKASASFGSRTDVGCVREHNEDSLTVAPPLYVVCDGMGGHAAGEVASEIAVNTIAKRAPQHADANALGQAVEEANIAIIRAARRGLGRAGMGTTCTAAILEKNHLVIAQVGDSRAYLLHNGRLQQITRDHSLVTDLIEKGEITAEEAKTHPQRSVITRALGSDPRTEPDLYELIVSDGDRLMLCSDGLSGMLEDYEIEDILQRYEHPQRCANQLVKEAINAGGHDNVTVIVVDANEAGAVKESKVARKTKLMAGLIVGLLALILGLSAVAVSLVTNNSAYLTEEDGRVAIYRGIPGEIMGISFSELEEITDVYVDDLQPGLANRLSTGTVSAGSVEDAKELVRSYEMEIAVQQGAVNYSSGGNAQDGMPQTAAEPNANSTGNNANNADPSANEGAGE